MNPADFHSERFYCKLRSVAHPCMVMKVGMHGYQGMWRMKMLAPLSDAQLMRRYFERVVPIKKDSRLVGAPYPIVAWLTEPDIMRGHSALLKSMADMKKLEELAGKEK